MSGHCVECIFADKSAKGDNVSGSHAVDVRGYSGSYKERFTD